MISRAPSGQASVLEGVLDRIVYSNDESAWSVVRLAVSGRRDPVTAVGNLLGTQPGESLRLRGGWVTDRKYGEQFRVESYVTTKPATLGGIEKYLASGLVRGLGKAMAARLVERFQLETLDVIEGDPERLTEVDGIGPVRSRRIREAWAEQRQIKDVMIFLQTHGVSTAYAVRIYKRYGGRSIGLVRDNPYRLAADIFGIGFKTADKIAAELGIAPDSPRRAEAGVLYVLSKLCDSGHVYGTRPQLVEEATAMLEIASEGVEAAIDAQILAGELVQEPSQAAGSEGEQAVYLKGLHIAEKGSAQRLRELLETPLDAVEIDSERAIAWFEQSASLSLAAQQREALARAIDSKVLVITGGPGTGKTTIVNGIIRILERKERRILLCAPTGRAAKRLSEATGQPAKTIHRLLEFSPQSMRFDRNVERPLEADLVVVDEASMIDTMLLYALAKAIPRTAQLVLVGDVDQLPSVGPGSVLDDLIQSGRPKVVRLTEIFRQAQQSLIVVNAHRVNGGQMPRTRPRDGSRNAEGDLEDFFFIERGEPERVLETVKELLASRIARRFAVHPIDDIQVLTPMRKGQLGVTNLNAELQALLNPGGESLTRGSRVFRVGDKVMQIRNNYDLDVFNGDIGRIKEIDLDERTLAVQLEDRLVRYDASDLDDLVLAYACSIHKAQGSEYPVVVIPLHTQHYALLQRNLLYTGITRGRRLVVIVGSRRAAAIAVKNDRVQTRNTRLAERLRGTLGSA